MQMDGPTEPASILAPAVVDDTVGVAVVVVTYNSAKVLPGLLDSIPDGLAGISRHEIIIVDNDSHDTSVDIALAHPTHPRVIRMGRNAGYAAGINAATAIVGSEVDVLILNPDVRLLPGSVRLLSKRLSDPTAGIVVPQILHEDGTTALSLRREPSMKTAWSDALLGTTFAARIGAGEIVDDPAIYDRGGVVEWATGAALLVGARARRVVGEWDESFFLYSEEVDYLERVRRSGLSVVYHPQAQVVHIGGEYHDNPFLSALMTKNRIRYYRRHHGRLSTALFRLSIVVGETMRFTFGPGHRAALRAALTL
jgi:N-acetylglucosaminyl-diphospho-decaprenol L-rhamnosyltransferase